MEAGLDEDYVQVRDYSLSDLESEPDSGEDSFRNSQPSTPATAHTTASSSQLPCREKRLQCPYVNCTRAFNRQSRLEEHIRSHTNERPFKCDQCDKDYRRSTHLAHHKKSAHSTVRDHRCTWPGCNSAFATGTRLRTHLKTHSGDNKYRCTGYQGCSEVFRKKETLQRHVMIEHENRKPFPCQEVDLRTGLVCTKAFDTAAKLKQHERCVHDMTRFSCDECLAFNAALDVDDTVQDDDKFSLQRQAYFATNSELQAHNKFEHPPTCISCSMTFSTNRELTSHLEIIHQIFKPDTQPASHVACPYPECVKVFSKKGNLKVHIKTVHEKRREFVCGETRIMLAEIAEDTSVVGCGSAFTTKAVLEEHVRTVHLGMESKKARRRKRKAVMAEQSDEAKTAKKPRKDKGIKKKSAIDDLVHPHILCSPRNPDGLTDPDVIFKQTDGHVLYMDPLQLERREDEDESADEDEGQLTGSVTMHGGFFFDKAGAYTHGDSRLRRLETGLAASTINESPPQEKTDALARKCLRYDESYFAIDPALQPSSVAS